MTLVAGFQNRTQNSPNTFLLKESCEQTKPDDKVIVDDRLSSKSRSNKGQHISLFYNARVGSHETIIGYGSFPRRTFLGAIPSLRKHLNLIRAVTEFPLSSRGRTGIYWTLDILCMRLKRPRVEDCCKNI